MKLLLLLSIFLALSQIRANNTYLTGGGCAEIPGLGSPILMISNAHKYIEDALHIKNNYTVIKYIHYTVTASANVPGQNNYKLAFSITDYNGTRYLGIDATISPFGIGGVTINKFILTKNIAVLKQVVGNTVNENNSYQCGDLKLVYSSYGNDPTPDLNSVYPGRNYNSAGLSILNQLNQTTAQSAKNKVCVTLNFIETAGFFGTPGIGAPVDLLHCLPSKAPVAAISVGCTAGLVTSLQLTFNNQNDNGTTQSPLIGNPLTPASAITTISLKAADRISFTALDLPSSLKIETLDENGGVTNSFTCGVGVAGADNVIVAVSDFLGLTDVSTNGVAIESFEITQYDASG